MGSFSNRFDDALSRRPARAAVVALGAGALLGPLGLKLLPLQMADDVALVETSCEVALLVSLFCLGLRLQVPIEWPVWRTPLRLATLTLLATAAIAAAAAHLLFDMTLGEALLLGAIIAPTDCFNVGEVFVAPGARLRSQLGVRPGRGGAIPSAAQPEQASRFVLAAESGINSGLAVVLVVMVLAFMQLGDSDVSDPMWESVLSAATAAGGFALGWLVGAVMAHAIRRLDPTRQADYQEEVLVFVTAPLACSAALALHTNAFLGILAAGIALSHGGRILRATRNRPLMPRVVRIAGRLERLIWLAVIVLLGVLAGGVELKFRMFLFAALLLLLIRPLAVRLGLGGVALPENEWRGVAWYPARGVGSLYCLFFALDHELPVPFARQIAGITVVVLVGSLLASAISGLRLSRASPGTVDL